MLDDITQTFCGVSIGIQQQALCRYLSAPSIHRNSQYTPWHGNWARPPMSRLPFLLFPSFPSFPSFLPYPPSSSFSTFLSFHEECCYHQSTRWYIPDVECVSTSSCSKRPARHTSSTVDVTKHLRHLRWPRAAGGDILWISRGMLQQCLGWLEGNAIDHSPASAEIGLSNTGDPGRTSRVARPA